MELRLSRPALEEIERHAAEAYPEECCGIVVSESGRDSVRRITNVQNRLHERDPATFPRDARTAYNMDPKEREAVEEEVEKLGRPIRCFYHSHPDHGAYFSAEDRAAATPFGEPSYPRAYHLVIAVTGGKVTDRLAVGWDAARADFVPVSLTVDG
jgi:proteasome lid subunit RPN8/RPN11